ncbi:MAG: lysophospholipid acyltransferase family protein [Ignavibacteriae bacterium]|nr:lysophospholipid acyltransferase family protein [Ignavibacteriota bacterium]
MPEQHPFIKFIVAIIGWMLTPFVFIFWNTVVCMPESLTLKFARTFGTLYRRRTLRMTMRNMRIILSKTDWRSTQWINLWESHAEQAALTIFELIHLSKMSHQEIQKRITIEGEHNLKEALANGKGVMLFLNHLGNLTCPIFGLAVRGYRITFVRNHVWIPFLEQKLRSIESYIHASTVLIGKEAPELARRTFQQNGIFVCYIDFSVIPKHTVWLPFGYGQMKVPLGPAIIALRYQVPVICVNCIRVAHNVHRVVIYPPLQYHNGSDIHCDAQDLLQQSLQLVESDVQAHPEQWWLWNYAQIRPVEKALPQLTTQSIVER